MQHHNVFFGGAYRDEFDAIFRRGALPRDPTVYLCAQDRGTGDMSPDATERLLLLVNAPPNGDSRPRNEGDIAACQSEMLNRLGQCGLHLRATGEPVMTGPAEFNALFPGTGGRAVRGGDAWQSGLVPPAGLTHAAGGAVSGGGLGASGGGACRWRRWLGAWRQLRCWTT